MQKLTIGALAASIALIATPALAQDPNHDGRDNGGHMDHHGGDAMRGPGGDQHGGPGMGDRNGPAMRGNPMDHGGPGMGGDRMGGDRMGGDRMGGDHMGGMGGHRFARGGRFNPGWAPGYRTVGSWQHYHLRRPPHGYHWVWYDGNFLLVAIGSGIIASMIAGAYGE